MQLWRKEKVMPRYIDADILNREIDKFQSELESNNDAIWEINKPIYKGLCYARGIINDIPTADVVEVKRGHWIPSPDGINPIRCSECNMPAPFAAGVNEFGDFECCRYPSSYCPECGAKMDVKKKDNTERVRCKDCIHFKTVNLRKRFEGYCELDFMTRKANNFCGNAERRER